MADPFEYDVFLSFSSADEEIVKPIWQELCSNGLRVFWSDATLKREIGNSWFEVIEKSLEQSRHMLLVCSDNSMNSRWVQREYRAFFDYCYSPGSRRLIPLLTHEFKPNNLPIFLRELQVGKVSDSKFIQGLIPILGGVNIEKLQQELKSLQEQIDLLLIENRTLISENASLREQIITLNNEIRLLPPNNSDDLFTSEIKTEKQPETQKETVAKPEGTTVTLSTEALSRLTEKANQQILDESLDNDKEINALIERLQDPMAYIRESTLKDINRRNISDPRVMEIVEKLATSDRVDVIRNLAQKTLITLKKNAKD